MRPGSEAWPAVVLSHTRLHTRIYPLSGLSHLSDYSETNLEPLPRTRRRGRGGTGVGPGRRTASQAARVRSRWPKTRPHTLIPVACRSAESLHLARQVHAAAEASDLVIWTSTRSTTATGAVRNECSRCSSSSGRHLALGSVQIARRMTTTTCSAAAIIVSEATTLEAAARVFLFG